MPERISADPDTGKATVKRTAFDLDTDQTLSLVSCDVIRTNDQDTSGQANPPWFADLGLVSVDNANRHESEHTAEFHTADAAAAGVSYFEYRIVVTDGTFEADLMVPVVLAGKGQPGAAALFVLSESGMTRAPLPYTSGSIVSLSATGAGRADILRGPTMETVEHLFSVYGIAADINNFSDFKRWDVNDGNLRKVGEAGDQPHEITYDEARDEIIYTCAFGDNAKDLRSASAPDGANAQTRWKNPQGRVMQDFVFDPAEDAIYARESSNIDGNGLSLYKRRANDGMLLQTLSIPPFASGSDRYFLQADFGAGYIFAVGQNANGLFCDIGRYDVASDTWNLVYEGEAASLTDHIFGNFYNDPINQNIYLATDADGVFAVNYDGSAEGQIVAPTESWWQPPIAGLALFVNPA